MTLHDRVAATGRLLSTIAIVRAMLLGASAGGAVAALALLLANRGTASSALLFTLAIAVAVGVGFRAWRQARGSGFTVGAVALWIEERIPSLNYRLVTAVDVRVPALERAIVGVDWTPVTREAARRALLLPGTAALIAVMVLMTAGRVAPAVSRLAADVTSALRASSGAFEVTVRVTPPAYTGRAPETLRNPSVIRVLVGSTVSVAVPGRDSAIVRSGSRALAAGVPFPVADAPMALEVRSGGDSRLMTIDPVPDSVPVVQLQLPARDTVLEAAAGTFSLGATVRDDLGLRRAQFEYIVSSGSGESFTFASGVLGAVDLGGAASGRIASRLALADLDLEPGAFVHVRAVALDRRGDTASARGVSETRTIRVARTGEFDSVSVEAAPPAEADKAILSQRMLINLAEALVRRKPDLDRGVFTDESRAIGRDQARLRRQVSDIVFARLGDNPTGEHFHGDGHQHEGPELRGPLTPDELLAAAERAAAATAGQTLDFHGDETPIVAVNRPLLEAYNFMWEAGRELEQGAPERALPSMYRALEAIQRARAAERLYLRGRPPRAVVDVDRVRLQGREQGTPAAREPRSPDTGVARAALARFARVVTLVATDPGAAADSLLLLRIDLLGVLPPGAANGAAEAADALRSGRDATAGLVTLRRALGPPLVVSDSVARWSGAR